jgi:hypothetical protein
VIGVEIPGAHHRALIGRGGQHLNELQQRTDTQVQFPGSRSYNAVGEMINADELGDVDPANIVKVSGPKAGCEKAIQDLKVCRTDYECRFSLTLCIGCLCQREQARQGS